MGLMLFFREEVLGLVRPRRRRCWDFRYPFSSEKDFFSRHIDGGGLSEASNLLLWGDAVRCRRVTLLIIVDSGI